ncbi:DUF1800 family protein [Akkermansiaceae bacterium]|nr:DUF1800 family protein [Akkermansiaceae bacterium]
MKILIVLVATFSFPSILFGLVDFNGNGVSDIWELQYGATVAEDFDSDNDGISNQAEGIAGTDPHDPTSLLALEHPDLDEAEVRFSWSAEAGKSYRIERWDPTVNGWSEAALILPLSAAAVQSVTLDRLDGGVFRLVSSDIDMDGDGLSAWEEVLMGTSDESAAGVDGSGEGDFVNALRALESEGGVILSNGTQLDRRLPSKEEAARFLLRASFGPTDESIEEVMSMGLSGWIDNQETIPTTRLQTSIARNALPINSSRGRDGWWRSANVAPDQLRQRIAYALSQILVVNFQGGSVIGDNYLIQARYYDIFTTEAFGSYRNVLEKVTYSPALGFYLSHLNNRKSDDPVNPTRFPDENFAREIMQLFTIGLWELNLDGSRKLDQEGNFIPTYDNQLITEMAKVFTGMSHSTTNNGRAATSFHDVARGNDYLYNMKVWDEEHEPGPKSIINGVELDGNQTGEEEVQAALDALVAHPSVPPFLSRLLIQRFTSSNPSAAYLARVSRVWVDDSTGESADLGEVIKAILLDPEVLNGGDRDQFHGKVREPIIRYASLARAFNLVSESGKYSTNQPLLNDDFGQFPMLAPSVFNFYLPDFAPEGEFREAGMVSPELQLASLSQMLRSDSRFAASVEESGVSARFDFTRELALVSEPSALVSRVDLLMTGGRLKAETKLTILNAVQNELTDLEKVRTAIYLVSQSMECIVLN